MGEAEEEEKGREARPPPWSRVRTRTPAVRGAGRRDPGRGAPGAGRRGLDSGRGRRGAAGPGRVAGVGRGPRYAGLRVTERWTAGSSSRAEVAECGQWERSPAGVALLGKDLVVVLGGSRAGKDFLPRTTL